jgi:FHS family L-fucose permease-like MFS transporter
MKKESNKKTSENIAKTLFPLILIVALFFIFGMGSSINDILIAQFKKTFDLNDFESGFVQTAFYLGYFVFAIPASLIMRHFNYKFGIITGLCLLGAGAFLFYPAAQTESYNFFLFALFVIASGLTFLETASNPYVTVLGDPKTATIRLNLAQSFNPIGCVTGILVGQQFILSGIEYGKEQLAAMTTDELAAYRTFEAHTVQMPYLIIGIGALIMALIFILTKFPTVRDEESKSRSSIRETLQYIFGKKYFVLAVVSQFFYIGAQACIWSYLIRYIQGTIPETPEKLAANFLIVSLVVFTAGRFFGTLLMKKIKANNLLWIYAVINMVLLAITFVFPGKIGLIAMVSVSFFMSIMYPTNFSLGVRDLGEHTKLASSILVMAIIGGALITPLMGLVSHHFGIAKSVIVPFICFVAVAFYGLNGYKSSNLPETKA